MTICFISNTNLFTFVLFSLLNFSAPYNEIHLRAPVFQENVFAYSNGCFFSLVISAEFLSAVSVNRLGWWRLCPDLWTHFAYRLP